MMILKYFQHQKIMNEGMNLEICSLKSLISMINICETKFILSSLSE